MRCDSPLLRFAASLLCHSAPHSLTPPLTRRPRPGSFQLLYYYWIFLSTDPKHWHKSLFIILYMYFVINNCYKIRSSYEFNFRTHIYSHKIPSSYDFKLIFEEAICWINISWSFTSIAFLNFFFFLCAENYIINSVDDLWIWISYWNMGGPPCFISGYFLDMKSEEYGIIGCSLNNASERCYILSYLIICILELVFLIR
jgi:hypothetical protein